MSFPIIKSNFTTNQMLVEIVPSAMHRQAQDIVCVVDVSGSMSDLATMKTTEGSEENGLSILDIVKHSLTTIISSLKPNDRFSLICFSDSAQVVIPLDYLQDNLETFKSNIDGLRTLGMTNLWDGLLKGMEELKTSTQGLRNKSIILLTDGQPNTSPPSGEINTFKKYLEMNKSLLENFTLHTCGFGYNLNSAMLVELANLGNGSYSFIPDSGMVGTIFINLLSNIFNSNSINLKLTLPYPESFFKNLNGYQYTSDSTSTTLHLKSLSNDYTKVVFLESNEEFTNFNLKLSGFNIILGKFNLVKNDNSILEEESFVNQFGRYQFINSLIKSLNTNNFGEFNETLNYLTENPSEFNKNLMVDIQGQIKEAFSREDWMRRWGRHYLTSLLMAHQNQWCNNFKDSSVQNYQSELFKKYQSEIESIFINLPAPKPTHQTRHQVSNMSSYYSSGNPCYLGHCLVRMANNSFKYVSEIKKGDYVYTPYGNTYVRCVLKTLINDSTRIVTFPSGLQITPYHPVRIDNQWYFPSEKHPVSEINTNEIYSFVLNNYHLIEVNQVETVTLGHSFQESKVRHPYFGSQKIINDLSKHPEWVNGLVVIKPNSLIRDGNTSQVCGIRF